MTQIQQALDTIYNLTRQIQLKADEHKELERLYNLVSEHINNKTEE